MTTTAANADNWTAAQWRAYRIVTRGTPAYWVTEGMDGGDLYTPCRVVSVEETPDGRMLATFQTRYIQSAGEVGPVIVARGATGVRDGRRVTLRPSIGVPDAVPAR